MGNFNNQMHFPCVAQFMRGARNVGKLALLAACGFLFLSLHPQELHHTAGVINVEVPVRVFDGERFVDDLTLKDFVVFEDGKPQKIVSLYLIRKANIQKEEMSGPAAAKPAPKAARTIVIQFEVLDPMPKLDDAVDFFFAEVIQPEDSLIVITPRTTYRFKPEALARLPRQEIARQLKAKLRKDILAGATEYKRLLGEIKDVGKMPVEPDQKLMMLSEIIRQLRDRIRIDPAALRRLAQTLKALEGQKYVFLFYERELINDPSLLFGNFGDESLPAEERNLTDMAATEIDRSPDVTPKSIEQIFSDASVTAHFIYLTQSKMNAAGVDAEAQTGGRATLKDMSAQIYETFNEMARTTGGVSEASGNPFAALRKAATATENYYLLYYVPENYQADGKFKEIKVIVKGKRFRVTNRAGYFAN